MVHWRREWQTPSKDPMQALLHSVPPILQQATADPRLRQRLLDTHRQVWVSLLWGHCSFLLGPSAHKVLFVPSKSLFPQSCVSSGGCSIQFSSVSQSCPTLCNPMNCSTPGLPAHHQLPEFTQTHVHQVGDAIQPSHPLLSPFPPAPNPSQHQSLFQ